MSVPEIKRNRSQQNQAVHTCVSQHKSSLRLVMTANCTPVLLTATNKSNDDGRELKKLLMEPPKAAHIIGRTSHLKRIGNKLNPHHTIDNAPYQLPRKLIKPKPNDSNWQRDSIEQSFKLSTSLGALTQFVTSETDNLKTRSSNINSFTKCIERATTPILMHNSWLTFNDDPDLHERIPFNQTNIGQVSQFPHQNDLVNYSKIDELQSFPPQITFYDPNNITKLNNTDLSVDFGDVNQTNAMLELIRNSTNI